MALRSGYRLVLLTIVLLSASVSYARGDLSRKQAQKLIRTFAGARLPSDSIRIERVVMTGSDEAHSTAELKLVFRVSHTDQDGWQLREVRTGQGSWEALTTFVHAAGGTLADNDCNSSSGQSRSSTPGTLPTGLARCLVASLFGVELPSEQVRIKEISNLGLPIASEISSVAVALVQLEFGFRKENGAWHLAQFKSGGRSWISLEGVPAGLDSVKRSIAKSDLEKVATALEAYRKQHGSFVVSDKHRVLIDHLSPRYLASVTRLDPWNRPYVYEGESDHFVLRSIGPDAKANTPDDIVVSH